MAPLSSDDLELGADDSVEPANGEPPAPQRITFEPEALRGRRGSNDGASGRRRSASRDSISSVRSRTRSVTGVPIEFRSLSFQVGESQAKGDKKPIVPKPERRWRLPKQKKKADKEPNQEDREYFANLDFHLVDGSKVCDEVNVSPERG